MHRLIETIRPRWVIAENVAGHISMGLDDVLADLEGSGYAWWTFVIPACAVDARHRRDRVWIVADSRRQGLQEREVFRRGEGQTVSAQQRQDTALGDRTWEIMANTKRKRPLHRKNAACNGREVEPRSETGVGCAPGQWPTEPSVGRVAHGVPQRVDRLKAIGNAVVPAVVQRIGEAIMEAD